MSLIERQAAIDAINHICPIDTEYDCTLLDRVDVRCVLTDLPSAQTTQTNCEYCHTDIDGYIFPLDKNSHAFIDRDKIVLKANGWRGEAKIKYCPICGRRLTDG